MMKLTACSFSNFFVSGGNAGRSYMNSQRGTGFTLATAVKDGKVTFTGSGYGHGVGMSQWGAYALALDGRTAEEIISWYYSGVGVATVW